MRDMSGAHSTSTDVVVGSKRDGGTNLPSAIWIDRKKLRPERSGRRVRKPVLSRRTITAKMKNK